MSYYSHNSFGGSSAFPPIIKNLLIINGLVFLGQLIVYDELRDWFALWPLKSNGFQVWQLITYSFLHGGFGHLLFNMFALWMFGMQIENTWGSRRFTVYYASCVVGAALVQLIATHYSGTPWPTLGASGGVFGILLAFGMMFPEQRIMLLFPPIPIKAKYFVIGYGVLELYFAGTGSQPGVANLAHLGGMVAGFLMIMYWRGKLPWKPKQTGYYSR